MGCTSSISPDTEQINTNHPKTPIALLIGSKSVGKTTLFKSIRNQQLCFDDKYFYLHDKNAINIKKGIQKECIGSIIHLYHQTLTQFKFKHTKTIQNFTNKTHKSFQYIRKHSHIRNAIIAKHINYLWNLPEIKHTFYNNVYFNNNIHYFFNIIENIMDPKYKLSNSEYKRVYIKSDRNLINQCYDKENNIKYIDSLPQNMNINYIKNTGCNYILYVVALNHYWSNTNINGKITNGILESVHKFNKIYKQLQKKQKQIRIILILNKIDHFKKYLKFRSLNQMNNVFTNNVYNGKNYSDKCNDSVIINRILNDMSQFQNQNQIQLPNDIAKIIQRFCGEFFTNYWLNLCCDDGIQYIRKLFLNGKTNVYSFQLSAINTKQAKHLFNDIADLV